MMIPFLSQDNLILDNKRQIIPGGKIEVFDPISNTQVDIYTYDGSNERYTVATNPVYLNLQSRPEYTYFCDRLVLCRLYKYIGNFSDPLVDDDTNNWQFIREWNGAFTEDSAINDTVLYGIESLADANTDLGSVTVVGYYDESDCEARTYYWDENCSQTPDNGYIVKSNNSDTGRWILKFDGEYLPSTYYGVYPGTEANINALLTYVDTVGTNSRKTAPGVYFVRGDYTHSTALTTSKKIQIDAGTTFATTLFTCANLDVIGKCSAAIGDFSFSASADAAHSSWFKDVNRFLKCGSKHLIVDDTNYFTTTSIDSAITLTDTLYEGHGTLGATYTSSGYIKFDSCTIIGTEIFNASVDKLVFVDTEFKEEYFTTNDEDDFKVGDVINDNDRLELDTPNLNEMNNSMLWLKIFLANGGTVLNGQGRSFDTIASNTITYIRDANITTLTISGVSSITLDNCIIGSASISGATSLTVRSTHINFAMDPTCTVNIVDCIASGTSEWRDLSDVNVVHSTWSIPVNRSHFNNTEAQTHALVFTQCDIIADMNIKKGYFTQCRIRNQMNLIPWQDSDTSTFYISDFSALNCVFNTGLALTKYSSDSTTYGVVLDNVNIRSNQFQGAFTCRYWTEDGEQNTFLKMDNGTTQHIYSYQGNVGSCPAEKYEATTYPADYDVDLDADKLYWGDTDNIQSVFVDLNTLSPLGRSTGGIVRSSKLNSTFGNTEMVLPDSSIRLYHIADYNTRHGSDLSKGSLWEVAPYAKASLLESIYSEDGTKYRFDPDTSSGEELLVVGTYSGDRHIYINK